MHFTSTLLQDIMALSLDVNFLFRLSFDVAIWKTLEMQLGKQKA